MHPQDTSFLVNGFKPTVAAAQPQDVAAFQTQQALARQQIQSGGLDLQQKNRDLQDQQIYSQAMQGAGGDPQKALMAAAQAGMSGKGIMQYQQMLLKNRETQAAIGKSEADAGLARTNTQIKSNEMVVGTTGSMLAKSPEQRAAAYPAAMLKLAQDMGVDPKTLPQDYQSFGGDQALQDFHDQHQSQLEQLAQQKAAQEKAAADLKLQTDKAEEARKTAKAPFEQSKAESDAKIAGNTVITGAPDPVTGLTKEQTQTAKQAKAALDQKTANDKAQRGIEYGKLAIDQKKFDATFGAGLDANGKPLSPEERKAAAMLDPTAVAQANYQIPGPSSLRTTPISQAQMAKILAINPSYDGMKYAERNKIAQDFSAAGASGKQITSSDTGLAHIATVSKAGLALKNGDVKVLNELANSLGAQIGKSPKNTYDTIVQMVAPEISKAVIGEAGGEGERQAMAHRFSSDTNDETREQALGAAAGLLGARVHKMAQAYESDMGKPLERKLSPESQAVLDKYTGGQAASAQAAPKVGTVLKGHIFLGGDPSKPESWKKQ